MDQHSNGSISVASPAVSETDDTYKQQIIDGFTSITEGNPELLDRLITSFKKVSDETLATVQHYPEELSDEQLYDQVHKIKPMLDYLGFRSRENCIAIKEGLKDGKSVDIETEIEALISDLETVNAVVREQFNS